ncbi:hypothetical protein JCM10296v2_002603 [Rhodotorula toruloides]
MATQIRLETDFVVASRNAVKALTLALAEDEGRHRLHETRRRLRPRKAVIFVPAIGRTAGLGQLLAKLLDQMRSLEDLDLRFGNAWMRAWPELHTFDMPNIEWLADGVESIDTGPLLPSLFPPILRDLRLNMSHYQSFHLSLASYLRSPAATLLRRLELRGMSNPPGPGVQMTDLLDGILQVAPRLASFALTIAVRRLDIDTYPDFTAVLQHLSSAKNLTFSPALFQEGLLLPSLLPFASRNLQSLFLDHDEGFLPTVPDLPANYVLRFLDDLALPLVEQAGRTLNTLIIYRDTHRVWSYETRQEMREKAAKLGLKLHLA